MGFMRETARRVLGTVTNTPAENVIILIVFSVFAIFATAAFARTEAVPFPVEDGAPMMGDRNAPVEWTACETKTAQMGDTWVQEVTCYPAYSFCYNEEAFALHVGEHGGQIVVAQPMTGPNGEAIFVAIVAYGDRVDAGGGAGYHDGGVDIYFFSPGKQQMCHVASAAFAPLDG